MFKTLPFQPLPGLASPHVQMAISTFGPTGAEPPSTSMLVPLGGGDQLACEVSTPPSWQPHQMTIALLHGLGGSHLSPYMIRMARKIYQSGLRVVRINLRGIGAGKGLSRLPYHSGNSQDIVSVLETLKLTTPHSPIHLIGFSLGGNIVMKMAGELGERASHLVERLISVCPVLDIAHSVRCLERKSYWLYHQYYLKSVLEQGQEWLEGKTISSIHDFDQKITTPLWGFAHPKDYYEKCSSIKFIPEMKVHCDLLFAADDPFVDYTLLKNLPNQATAWLTPSGSHMAFIGWAGKEHGFFWMDQLLLSWLK